MEDFELQTVCLKFLETAKNQTSANIANDYQKFIDSYEITNRITTITIYMTIL